MLNDISTYNFLDMSPFVRLEGKHTTQTAHCASYYARPARPSDLQENLDHVIYVIYGSWCPDQTRQDF